MSRRSKAERIGREFADNAEESRGRSMILMGAGTNHWFHSDTIYRAFLALTTLTGCQGVNGGGWAHYVGQEKCRPVTGWAQLAFGLRLVATAAADDPDGLLVPALRPVPLRPLRSRHAVGHDRRGPARREDDGRHHRPVGADGLDAVVPDLRPQPAHARGRRRSLGADGGRLTSSSSSSPATSGSPAKTPTPRTTTRGSSPSGGPTCSARPRRATSTSSSTCWGGQLAAGHRGATRGATQGRGLARRGTGGQARPAAVAGLPDDESPRSSPTSCCRPPPGTRSTTSTPPTCTRSSTRSTRR